MTTNSNPTGRFILVSLVGHCAILALEVEKDQYNQPIYFFFATFMITSEDKPAIGFEEASVFQKISYFRNSYNELVGFCQGYTAAAQERRNYGVRPHEWLVQESPVSKSDIRVPDAQERTNLMSYPEFPVPLPTHPVCPSSGYEPLASYTDI